MLARAVAEPIAGDGRADLSKELLQVAMSLVMNAFIAIFSYFRPVIDINLIVRSQNEAKLDEHSNQKRCRFSIETSWIQY